MEPFDFDKLQSEMVERHGQSVIREEDVMSAALYPKVTEDYINFRDAYGPVNTLNTRLFLVGPSMAEEFDVSIK